MGSKDGGSECRFALTADAIRAAGLDIAVWRDRLAEARPGAATEPYREQGHLVRIGVRFGQGVAGRRSPEPSRAAWQPAPPSAAPLGREPPAAVPGGTVRQLLEAFAVPALVADQRGSVLAANRKAALAVERRGNLRLDAAGHLRSCDPVATSALITALRRAAQAEDSPPADVAVRAPDGYVAAIVSLFPLMLPSGRSPDPARPSAPETFVLLLLHELAVGPFADVEALIRLFHLTSAEARLAARLASGESLQHAAAALRVGRETARTHLHAVFSKTRTHRQSELVALLARLPAANRPSARGERRG